MDENRCKQKNKLIQIMGSLYRYISYIAFTCNDHIYCYLPVSMKNGIVLLSCIFEPTVPVFDTVSPFSYAPFLRAHIFSQKCWNRTFFYDNLLIDILSV